MSPLNKSDQDCLTAAKVRAYAAFSNLSESEAERLVVDIIRLSKILIEAAKQNAYETSPELPAVCKKEKQKTADVKHQQGRHLHKSFDERASRE